MTDIELKLKEIENNLLLIISKNCEDTETDHIDADDLLCEALNLLGQTKIVEYFTKIGKWYS